MTGVVFSNIMLAALPEAIDNKVTSAQCGAVVDGGQDCNPLFFAVPWPNDAYHEAAGQLANQRDLKSVYLVAPNYQAGQGPRWPAQAHLQGPDRRRELHQAGPAGLRRRTGRDPRRQAAGGVHLPARRHGHQLHQAVRRARAWRAEHALLLPGFGRPGRHRPVGEAMAGIFNTAHWSPDFQQRGQPEVRRRIPEGIRPASRRSCLAGYDAAQLINAAVRDTKASWKTALRARKALKTAKFDFRCAGVFQVQHQPVPDPELLRAHGSVKTAAARQQVPSASRSCARARRRLRADRLRRTERRAWRMTGLGPEQAQRRSLA